MVLKSHFIVDENGIKDITSEELENLQIGKAGGSGKVIKCFCHNNFC